MMAIEVIPFSMYGIEGMTSHADEVTDPKIECAHGNHGERDANGICTVCGDYNGERIEDWQEWTTSNALPTSGHYYLGTDVNVSALTTTTGELYLDLNGYTISATSSTTTYVYSLSYNCNVYDTSENKEGTITDYKCCFYMAAGKELNIFGGNFVENQVFKDKEKSTKKGGVVYVNNNSTLNVFDGKFQNNADLYAGVFYIYRNGCLKIYGGQFLENKNYMKGHTQGACYGGGVIGIGGSSSSYKPSVDIMGGVLMAMKHM